MEISKLKLNPKNPRIIKDNKFEQLCKSIQEFPEMMEKRPIVCVTDVDGKLFPLGGNMRLKALKHMKFKDVPDSWVVLADDWTVEQRNEFTIRDNVGYGEWNWEELNAEWDADLLSDWGLDMPEFDEPEKLEAEEDDYEIPDEIQTDIVIGDLFEIGEHRLLCGDSTDSEQVAKLMNGEKADIIFTDPPYELDFNYSNALLFSENSHVFIFNNDRAIIRQLKESPFEFKKFFIFNHSGCAIPQEGGNECFLDHILISHEINGNPRVRFNKGDGLRTVIKGEYRKSELHKHEKPFNLLSSLLKGYSNAKYIVLDFFLGSGSTMVAAHQLKRKCYGMELDPKYCQVIVDRMRKLDPTLIIKRNGEVI